MKTISSLNIKPISPRRCPPDSFEEKAALAINKLVAKVNTQAWAINDLKREVAYLSKKVSDEK